MATTATATPKVATAENKKKEISITEDQFVTQLVENLRPLITPLETPPLPSGVRLFRQVGNRKFFVVELRPAIIRLHHQNIVSGYKLPMPWQYFLFQFSTQSNSSGLTMDRMDVATVAWSRSRVNSFTDRVSRAYLPNVYTNGQGLCWGNTMPDSDLPVARKIEEIINGFFSDSSLFNRDLGDNLPRAYRSFASWERAGKENSHVWMDWNFLDPDNQYFQGYRISDILHIQKNHASALEDVLSAFRKTRDALEAGVREIDVNKSAWEEENIPAPAELYDWDPVEAEDETFDEEEEYDEEEDEDIPPITLNTTFNTFVEEPEV